MHSLGSSYLIQQVSGSEQCGGASVKVCPKVGEIGMLTILTTDFRTHEPVSCEADFLRDVATRAYERFFRDYLFLCDDWDVEIFDFAYQPIDSGERMVHIAVYNALVSAFSTLDLTLAVWTRRRG